MIRFVMRGRASITRIAHDDLAAAREGDLTTTTTSAMYAAARQTADWGALPGSGDTLDIRIFQLSALIGRGAAKTTTLNF